MVIGKEADLYRAYKFKVDCQNIGAMYFTECSGIGMNTHSISYNEGGVTGRVRHLPGRVDYLDVTLRYGLTRDTERMWNWIMDASTGKEGSRQDISLIILSHAANDEKDSIVWTLENAWPKEWRGAPLNSLGQEIAFESITFRYEGIRKGQ